MSLYLSLSLSLCIWNNIYTYTITVAQHCLSLFSLRSFSRSFLLCFLLLHLIFELTSPHQNFDGWWVIRFNVCRLMMLIVRLEFVGFFFLGFFFGFFFLRHQHLKNENKPNGIKLVNMAGRVSGCILVLSPDLISPTPLPRSSPPVCLLHSCRWRIGLDWASSCHSSISVDFDVKSASCYISVYL